MTSPLSIDGNTLTLEDVIDVARHNRELVVGTGTHVGPSHITCNPVFACSTCSKLLWLQKRVVHAIQEFG